jgi:hypothetical protein
LAAYSTIPPITLPRQTFGDRGENEDPELYRRRVEGANGSNPQQDIDSVGNFTHWMHSFNSYETGVLWVKDPNTGVYTIDPRHF